MTYKCKDGYNGDVVYEGNSKRELKKAIQEYNKETEGDWFEVIYIDNKRVSYSEI